MITAFCSFYMIKVALYDELIRVIACYHGHAQRLHFSAPVSERKRETYQLKE